MKQRWCVVGAVAAMAVADGAAGCSFDGAKGRMMEPDGEIIDGAPDVGVDGPPALPAITCDGFTLIAGSYYRLLPDPVNRDTALQRCAALPGSHLATFELITEPAAVVTGLALTTPAWTGVEQVVIMGQSLDDTDWYNRVGEVRTPIPQPFPWRGNEPNDFDDPEDREEDFGELHPPGVFDDAPANRPARPLCECTPQVGI